MRRIFVIFDRDEDNAEPDQVKKGERVEEKYVNILSPNAPETIYL